MFKSMIKPHLFCYSHIEQVIAARATAVSAINISSDVDFELFEIRAVLTIDAQVFKGSVNFLLSTSDGNLFSAVAVNILSFASVQFENYSGYPIRLNEPMLIPANTVIKALIDNAGSEEITIQTQPWGYKRRILGEGIQ